MDNLMIKEGVPWKVINYYAEKINANCVVVGSMGRKGIAEKLIGNTA
jgi:universal stress protein E